MRAKDYAYRQANLANRRGIERRSANRRYHRDINASRARRRQEYRQNGRIRDEALRWKRENRSQWNEICRLAQQVRRARLRRTPVIPFTQEQLRAKVAYWGGACYMCGGEWTDLEHVKPVKKGGGHLLANIRPACRSCNASKSARWAGPRWAMNLIGSGPAVLASLT